MNDRLRRQLLALLVACIIAAVGLACSKDGGTSPSSGPTVSGCNSVTYQGFTYTTSGCTGGVLSYQTTIGQSGHTACFNITCSSGCVSTAKVC
jgi:hypothetical protein